MKNAEYVIDTRYLKQGLNNALVLKEYRTTNFNQNTWLQPKHQYTKKSKTWFWKRFFEVDK